MLELNSSFLWVFFLLWILYFSLERLFFRPVGGIIEQREGKAAADSVRQEQMVAEIESRTRSLEGQLGQARQEALRIREEWLRNGDAARARAIAAARERSAQVLAATIAQLDGEIALAERELEAQVAAFGATIKQAYL